MVLASVFAGVFGRILDVVDELGFNGGMDRREMAVLIGMQASGKSTFFRSCLPGFVHVSKDNFRHNKNKARRQEQLIREAAERGENVCVDNTNVSREDRADVLALGRELGFSVTGYVFEFDRERTLRWNLEREERDQVREAGIWATLKGYEPVKAEEGFDALRYVRPDGEGGFVVEEWKEQ